MKFTIELKVQGNKLVQLVCVCYTNQLVNKENSIFNNFVVKKNLFYIKFHHIYFCVKKAK